MPKFNEGINAILTTIMLKKIAELENLVKCLTIKNLKLKNHLLIILIL